MNKTPNPTAINNNTPTPHNASKQNYAQIAGRNSQQVPQSPVPPVAKQAPSQQPAPQPVVVSAAPQAVVAPQNQQPNAPFVVNGIKNSANQPTPSFAAAASKITPQQSQILPTNGTAATAAKRSSSPQTVTSGVPKQGAAKNPSVQLPRPAGIPGASLWWIVPQGVSCYQPGMSLHPCCPASIQFGSFNQPTSSVPLSTSPVQPGAVSGGPPPPSPTTSGVNFGTLPASNAAEEVVQPTPTTSSQAATTPARPPPVGARIPDIPRTHSAPPHLQSPDDMNPKFVSSQAPLTHQRKDSTHSNHSGASLADAQNIPPSQHPPHPPHFQHNTHPQGGQHHLPTQQHYLPPHHRQQQQQQHHQKHGPPMGMAPGQNAAGLQPPGQYGMPKKSIPPHSPHLASASAPGMPSPQVMPMVTQPPQVSSWNPPHYYHNQHQMYDPNFYQQQHMYMYQQRVPIGVQPAVPRLTPNATPFVPHQKGSKAIRIINPETRAEVKADANPPPGSGSPAKKEPATPIVIKMERPEDKQEKERKEKEAAASAPKVPPPGSPASKAIKIVDPATREKEEKEKKERDEKEKKAKEEKEAVERKAKEEVERKEREEKVRKEREEKERIEREEKEKKEREEKLRIEREEKLRIEREEKERKEREEKERIEREEKERKEQEERERIEKEKKEREERERKEREELERKEKEEKERLEKERLEKERLEKERLEAERLEKMEKERLEREERERKAAEEEAARKAAEAVAAAKLSEEKKLEEEAAAAKSKEAESVSHNSEKVSKAPGMLDLSKITSGVPRPLATPIRTPRTPGTPRRTLEDLGSVQYPPNVKTPNPANPEPGKFRYDRVFLMQFMDVCTEKPDSLLINDIGIEEGSSGDRRPSIGPRQKSNAGNHRSGPSKTPSGSQMSAPTRPSTSEDRFHQSNMRPQMGNFQGGRSLGPRTNSGNQQLPQGMNGGQIGGPGNQREGSQSGRPRRQDSGRGGVKGGRPQYQQVGGPTIPMDQVAPLEFSEHRWTPKLVNVVPSAESDLISIEVVTRKVKGLLNKLTLEKFETISDQIIEFANQSVKETDGTTLKVVIQLTFEKATDEPNFAVMYAQLAKKMLDKVSSDIKDDNVKDSTGKVITGGNLFRKYLLNRCQEDFERGWKSDLPKVDKNEDGTVAAGVDPLLTEEYYIAAKAKRRGLGLIKFIGELFKLQMLTERIMHECIKKLLSNVADPEEEETESLCKLMTTVGKDLDHKKAKGWMDVYFDRMGDLLKNPKLPSRIKFMIQDVIDLRSSRWVPRRDNNAPKTIQEIRDDALKAKEDEKENIKRTTSSGGPGRPNMQQQQLARGNSHRGGGKDPRGGVNVPPVGSQDGGWNTVPSTSSRKTGDLTQFGKIDRTKNSRVSLGPATGAVFPSLQAVKPFTKSAEVKKDEKAVPMSPTASSIGTTNMFSALDGVPERRRSIEEEKEKANTANERPRIKLLPRTLSTTPGSESPSTFVASPATETPVQKMNENEVKMKIDNMLKEFWSVADVKELVLCVKDLPSEYHSQTIAEILNAAIDKKENEVKMVAKAFQILADEKTVSKDNFGTAFGGFIEFIDDVSIDVPAAFKHTGILLIGARMELAELREFEKPLLSTGGLVPPAAKLTAEYLKALKADAGEEAMVHHYQEASFDFKALFPEDQRTDEAFNTFLERQVCNDLFGGLGQYTLVIYHLSK
ncbi:hypothetical protein BC938DRAFT_479072 [Jimgerdemannia flammicorona]|uniref:MI domain-containing protein n=1 Tax=Jimgerdemannia flammicorona TaxID=994334 RepID=A0A433QLN7_9FUNG|nr:hypothetical protein BC938DRAFT_479072 [Jimgerdemannia flammicorona]